MKKELYLIWIKLWWIQVLQSPIGVKNWGKVNELIPSFILYDGFEAVFDFIRINEIKVAVVSTAVSNYVNNVLNHFSIPHDVIIAYHDVVIKPNPEAFVKALDYLELNTQEAISLGIEVWDSRLLCLQEWIVLVCLWGTKEKIYY